MCNVNATSDKVEVQYSACVDGDTIKVIIDGEKYTVRLLAIDTPETVKPGTEVQPYGKEASEYTCDKIKNASKIELEYDEGSDKTDKYDRLLAWVYVDDSLLQKDLLSLGYAKVAYIYGDYKYTNDLYEVEKEAASSKLGIWSEEEYISSISTNEDTVGTETTEVTFWDELQDLITKYLKEIVKDFTNDLKKSLNKAIKSIFN